MPSRISPPSVWMMRRPKAVIDKIWRQHGQLIDPHSAIGLGAAWQAEEAGLVGSDTMLVSLACAHPAKFPDAVEKASGQTPQLPGPLGRFDGARGGQPALRHDKGGFDLA